MRSRRQGWLKDRFYIALLNYTWNRDLDSILMCMGFVRYRRLNLLAIGYLKRKGKRKGYTQ